MIFAARNLIDTDVSDLDSNKGYLPPASIEHWLNPSDPGHMYKGP